MNTKLSLCLMIFVGISLAMVWMAVSDVPVQGYDSNLVTQHPQRVVSTDARQNEHTLQKQANPTSASNGDTIDYLISLDPGEAISDYSLIDDIPSDLRLLGESVEVELANGGTLEPNFFCNVGSEPWPDCDQRSGVTIILWDDGPLTDTLTLRYRARIRQDSDAETIVNTVILAVEKMEVVSATAEVTNGEIPPTATGVARVAYMPAVRNDPSPTPTPPFPSIVNGNFESPRTEGKAPGWEESGVEDDLILCKESGILPNALNPRSPQCVAWLGGFDGQTTAISQTVTIDPYYQGEVKLKLYYSLGSSEQCGASGDRATVYVNGAPADEASIPELCNGNETPGWPGVLMDLGDVSGDVAIKFEVAQNESLNSNWFLDDVSLCSDDPAIADVPSCN